MHELGIATEVVELAIERARGAKIRRVVLEVGALTAVLPDALHFCFDLATQGTAAEGARLEIASPPARARCRACNEMNELTSPIARCTCGAMDFEWITGSELKLLELEVT